MKRWALFFRLNNKRSLDTSHWRAETSEPKWICRSIATFQLGESSDGAEFLARAKHSTIDGYYEAIVEFISDENKHAEWLRTILEKSDYPPRRHNWTDSIFRFLRHCGSYRHEHRVLLVAECFAMIFYPSLMVSCKSAQCREVCRNIIADEYHHLRFAGQSLKSSGTIRILPYLLLAFGAGLVASIDHYPVVRARYANPLVAGLKTAGIFHRSVHNCMTISNSI